MATEQSFEDRFFDHLNKSDDSDEEGETWSVQKQRKPGKLTVQAGTTLEEQEDEEEDGYKINCEYFQRCKEFVDLLELGDSYFTDRGKFSQCYCTDCHSKRGDNDFYTRGNPSSEYAIPIGWARFGLDVQKNKLEGRLKIDENWHVAFHGTRIESIADILDNGHLSIPGDVALGGTKLSERIGHFTDNWKPNGFDTKQIFVSPTIRYAGTDAYACPVRVTASESDEVLYKARVAFQVWIRPKSYEIHEQTIGAKKRIDPVFKNDVLEWSTKERAAVVPYGLLVKVNDPDDDDATLNVQRRGKRN
ncbi:neuralized-like protein 4 [Ptychodera flava]|uniref:neuralized-like protein 4 n=1 Tax=Ptychodera flava TaxID=63121 RepID=UPI00396A5B57